MIRDLDKKTWWNYIHEDIKELLIQSLLLVETADKWELILPRTSVGELYKKMDFVTIHLLFFLLRKPTKDF